MALEASSAPVTRTPEIASARSVPPSASSMRPNSGCSVSVPFSTTMALFVSFSSPYCWSFGRASPEAARAAPPRLRHTAMHRMIASAFFILRPPFIV